MEDGHDRGVVKMINYPQIGLNADWLYRAWLLVGDKSNGVVIYENVEEDKFELIQFERNEDCIDKFNTIYEAYSFDECLIYFKERVENE